MRVDALSNEYTMNYFVEKQYWGSFARNVNIFSSQLTSSLHTFHEDSVIFMNIPSFEKIFKSADTK